MLSTEQEPAESGKNQPKMPTGQSILIEVVGQGQYKMKPVGVPYEAVPTILRVLANRIEKQLVGD